jgi:peptidoglycan endopeptidase LytF
MNRKDTILVAVLINAGVLVVLFTSALKQKQSELNLAKTQNLPEVEAVCHEPVAILKDEIDMAIEQAIKERAQNQQPVSVPQEIVFDAETKDQSQELQTPNVPLQAVSYADVTVKQGDFLAKIAKRYNVTVEEIMRINNLKNSNLRVGQVLKVPKAQAQAPQAVAAAVKEAPKAPEGFKYYVVKAGDNPWTIAHKHNMKLEELLKMNQLTPEKAKSLKIGDKLKVKL